MAAYADYSYYSTTYLGTAIPEADFPRLALQSSNFINQVTFGRAASVTDEASMDQIKMACCAVAEAMQLELQGGPVVSESNDGWSRSYAQPQNTKTGRQRLYDTALLYLGQTDLMFPGVVPL
jgi:hypothetical protein